MYYCCNFLVYPYFKTLILNFAKDNVCYNIKQIIARIEIKLPIDNVTSQTIKNFSLNNINTIFHKYASFIRFLITTAVNIVAIDDSMPNSFGNHQALVNIETNVVIDFNPDNYSSNKNSYLSDDYSSLSNDNYYKDNLNNGSNGESGIPLTVSIKNIYSKNKIKPLLQLFIYTYWHI